MSGMSIVSSYDKAFDFSRGLFTEVSQGNLRLQSREELRLREAHHVV